MLAKVKATIFRAPLATGTDLKLRYRGRVYVRSATLAQLLFRPKSR